MTAPEILLLSSPTVEGTIPTDIGALSSLEYLALYNTSLTGSLPLELGSLSNLGEY